MKNRERPSLVILRGGRCVREDSSGEEMYEARLLFGGVLPGTLFEGDARDKICGSKAEMDKFPGLLRGGRCAGEDPRERRWRSMLVMRRKSSRCIFEGDIRENIFRKQGGDGEASV